jgi:hypothetical protein
MTTETNQIGEAPASATLSVVTPKGYNTLFSLREMDGMTLLSKITSLENKLEELGYKPQIKLAFGQKKEIEYVKTPNGDDMLCPTCKMGHVKIIHAKDGKTYYGCDQSKYDPITKTSTGCKYFTSEDPTKIKTDLIGHEWDDQYTEPQ